jgi:hypothetical protein
MGNKRKTKSRDQAGNLVTTVKNRKGQTKKRVVRMTPEEQSTWGISKIKTKSDRQGRTKKIVSKGSEGTTRTRIPLTERQAIAQANNPKFRGEIEDLGYAKGGPVKDKVINGKALRRSYARRKQT